MEDRIVIEGDNGAYQFLFEGDWYTDFATYEEAEERLEELERSE